MALQGHHETDKTEGTSEIGPKATDKKTATCEACEPTQLPPILTVDELAAFLRLNRKSVYAAISGGEIPGVRRIGGTIRVNRDSVLDWLAGEGRVPSSRSNSR